MQPVTPLRQQPHQQHNINSRPRRSISNNSSNTTTAATTAESSSRRSSRLQAANEVIARNSPVMLQYDLLKNTPPSRRRDHNTLTTHEEDSLAPPLALQTRKRTRSAIQAEEDNDNVDEEEYGADETEAQDCQSASAKFDEAKAHMKALAEYLEANREDILNGTLEQEANTAVGQAVLAVANMNQDAGQAYRQALQGIYGGSASGMQKEDALVDSPHDLADLRDLFANGRALYNATTTSLAAPAEIPSKRPRLTRDQQANEAAGPSNTNKRSAATHMETALATPKQTSRAPTDNGSRRPTSRRTAAVTAATAISNNSTSKRRSASRTTTAAGGSASKRSNKAQRDDERRHQQEQDALDWKKKYKRAFKSFVFYFDGFDAARKREAEKCVKDLGAQVESFFSKQVSHVVTTRPIPAPERASSALNAPAASTSLAASTKANIFQAPSTTLQPSGKENALHQQQARNSSESPSKQAAAAKDAFTGPSSRRSKTRLGAANPNNIMYPIKTPPKIKAFADFEKTESKDILVKAQSFGMKLWNVEKLQRVLERLMSDDSPSQSALRQGLIVNNAHIAAGHAFNLQMNGNAPRPSLPSLLRAEALTGSTYERDLNALRPDFHYFNPKNGYILVEDTSGEFQPAHAKEYSQRIHSKPGDENRDTEWPTLWGGQEGRQAFFKASSSYKPTLPSIDLIRSNERGCAIKVAAPSNTNSKKHNQQQQSSHIADPPSYLAASGNSQIITSNIQSGTSTRSGQVLGANGAKGLPTKMNGYIVDKRLARLGSKNAHIVTIGNNSTFLQQTSTRTSTSQNGSATSDFARAAANLKASNDKLRASLEKRGRIIPPRPEPKKPGYCENCRVRFEDFKTHTRTKKHRRFALDQSNWTQLDELFGKIKRPINPELLELYADADMQNDIPSDIEASDKEEEEEEYSDEEDLCEEDDSGFASLSFDYQPAACDAKRRKMRHGNTDEDEEDDHHRDMYAAMAQATNRQYLHKRRDDSEDEDSQENVVNNEGGDDEEDDDEEVVDTSEEEEALETASEEEDMSEDEQN
ncbi:hypothetical protein P389DRAFT_44432 [Cystobasidium minutum MCA 4210]|uniref:uncharacterized protein n=1 Tax=Cystobasidium minutum MCA 4210 TaxID=1397322 RepID=UPI0034CEA849|eukprot:jgi/Rhomi1/44432/CE44431_353